MASSRAPRQSADEHEIHESRLGTAHEESANLGVPERTLFLVVLRDRNLDHQALPRICTDMFSLEHEGPITRESAEVLVLCTSG